jgi:hypothetical protein
MTSSKVVILTFYEKRVGAECLVLQRFGLTVGHEGTGKEKVELFVNSAFAIFGFV